MCGITYGTASGWVTKKKNNSKLIDRHRWLYVESVIDFLKNHPTIKSKQCKAFDRRLIAVYESVKDIIEHDTMDIDVYLRIL